VLTSFVPGQEKGNAEFVTDSGAGLYAPRPRQLAAEVGRLRRDPVALGAMRDASARAGRPGAAVDIARFIAELAAPAELDVAAATVPDVPVGRDDEGVGWPSELLPALMAETAAITTAPASLRRLRRSGVLIRAALRDR
jgi:hypothetical protein